MEKDVSMYGHPTTQRFLKSFIAEYKASPELWNTTDPANTNKYRRLEAQDRLVAIYRTIQKDATRLDVRKKINTLRSNYNKELIKIRAAEAEGREYIPKNWLFHELRFLDINRKTEAHNGTTENEESESATESQDTIKTETYIVEVDDDEEPIQARKAKLKRNINIRKLKNEPHRKKMIQDTSTATSGIEPIALVWSAKLQNLRPNQRMFAEKAINDILFEAYLNNLGRGPMVINAMNTSVTPVDPEGFGMEVSEEYINCKSSDDED